MRIIFLETIAFVSKIIMILSENINEAFEYWYLWFSFFFSNNIFHIMLKVKNVPENDLVEPKIYMYQMHLCYIQTILLKLRI